jgi:glutamate-1-semialdehyde 2,1-aminomutase
MAPSVPDHPHGVAADMTETRQHGRLKALIEEQERVFLERHRGSARALERVRAHVAGGVTCSWQNSNPHPVFVSEGRGAKVYDVDGNAYVDLHAGYGVTVAGHGHPAIVRAVRDRIARGTHFCQPHEDAGIVAGELARRWGLPLWRFTNTGTETTMDAVHIMRAFTGRPEIVKVEGGYHGHHDSVMVSIYEEGVDHGPIERPKSVPSYLGVPQEFIDLTVVVPFNRLDVVEAVFEERSERIAGMILEPLPMNMSVVPPVEGFLEGVRAVTRRHGALLAFDEVKTGATVAPGGATELFGVTPDLVCLAKAIGGGLPFGAIGGTKEVMDMVATDRFEQEGTFNGNPLGLAAAKATLLEILNDDAYARFDKLGKLAADGCRRAIEEQGLEAYALAFGAKGSVTFSSTCVRDYRDSERLDSDIVQAHWLFHLNNGVFLTPWGGEWTLSVQHGEEDVARYVDNFTRFAQALSY